MNPMTENDLVLYYYSELDAERRADLERELESDSELRRRYADLCQVLNTVTQTETPEPRPGFEERIRAGVEARINSGNRNPVARLWRALTRPMTFGAGLTPLAATFVLLAVVAAFFLGRGTNESVVVTETAAVAENTDVGAFSEAARKRILLASVSEHLDRTDRLFTQVTNQSGAATPGPVTEEDFAESLLASNRIYRAAAERSGEVRIVRMLDLMEPILLELARRPDSYANGDRDSLQRRIDDNDLIFKVRTTRALLDRFSSPEVVGDEREMSL